MRKIVQHMVQQLQYTPHELQMKLLVTLKYTEIKNYLYEHNMEHLYTLQKKQEHTPILQAEMTGPHKLIKHKTEVTGLHLECPDMIYITRILLV